MVHAVDTAWTVAHARYASLTSTTSNYRIITSKAPDEESRKKVRMLTDYLQEHKNTDIVPDPYYGDLSDFDYALDLIEDACDGLLEQCL